MATSASAGRRAPLKLSGPESALGDGATPVTLRLSGPRLPAGDLERLIEIDAQAGSIGKLSSGEGGVSIEYRPPLVAAPMDVRVRVAVGRGKGRAWAETLIRIKAPAPVLSYRDWAGPLAMRAPDLMVLTRHDNATLSLNRPPSGMPVISANVGRVSALRADGDRLSFTYTPPAQSFPQLAILSVSDEQGALLDWLAIPLHGVGEIETETEANAGVTVLVGSRSFGPVRADRKGKTRLHVIAPPGLAQATTAAADALGNVRQAPFDLAPPPFSQVASLCAEQTGRMVILAANPDGTAMNGARWLVGAERGVMKEPQPVAPGVYQAEMRVPAAAKIDEVLRYSVSLRAASESQASCELRVLGGPAAKVRIAFDRREYVAGSTEPVVAQVSIDDASGRPAQPGEVAIDIDLGEIVERKLVSQGRLRLVWKLPDRLPPERKARMSVRAEPAQGEATLQLAAGPLVELNLSAADRVLAADGRATTQILVRPTDGFGNIVHHARLKASGKGVISAFAPNPSEPGHQVSLYTSPRLEEASEDVVRVRGQDIEASVPITLVPAASRFVGGAVLGYATNFGKLTKPLFMLDAAVRLPVWDDRLSVGAAAGYSWQTQVLESEDGEAIRTSVWLWPLLGHATVEWRLGRWGISGGLVAGAMVTGYSVSSATSGRVAETSTQWCAGGRGGADLDLGPGRLGAELWYLYAPIDSSTLRGNSMGALGGISYRLQLE